MLSKLILKAALLAACFTSIDAAPKKKTSAIQIASESVGTESQTAVRVGKLVGSMQFSIRDSRRYFMEAL
jgi:hypothetical protein